MVIIGGIRMDDVNHHLVESKIAWKVKLFADPTVFRKGKTQPKFEATVTLLKNTNNDLKDVDYPLNHTVDYVKMFMSNVPAVIGLLHDFIGFETICLLKEVIWVSEDHIIQQMKGDTDSRETIKRLPSSAPSSSSSASKKQKTEASSSSTAPSSETQVSILTIPRSPPTERRPIPIYEKPWGAPPGLNDDDIPLGHCDINPSTGYFTFARNLQNLCTAFDNNNAIPNALPHVSWAWSPAYLTSDYYTPNDKELDPIILPWLNFCASLGYIVMRHRPNFHPEIPLLVFQGFQLLHTLPIFKTKVRLSYLHLKRALYFYCMAFIGQEPDDPNGNYPPVPWLGGMTYYYNSTLGPNAEQNNGVVPDENTYATEIDEDPEFWDEWDRNPPNAEMMDDCPFVDWRDFAESVQSIQVILQ